MDNRALYDGFKNMEAQTHLMLNKFAVLRAGMTKVLEKNTELKIENQKLRAMLGEEQRQLTQATKGQSADTQKARQNLAKLYQQGFHICNQFFGKHRDPHENCLFCNEILFGRKK